MLYKMPGKYKKIFLSLIISIPLPFEQMVFAAQFSLFEKKSTDVRANKVSNQISDKNHHVNLNLQEEKIPGKKRLELFGIGQYCSSARS